MFSDSRAPRPGDPRGFKPNTANFFPWLRNGLKPHHSGDLGLNRAYKCGAEPHSSLTALERAKELIQGKEREKKAEVCCNGVGLARRLPVVLRGHHILPERLVKRGEDSPARGSPSPWLDPDSGSAGTQAGDGSQGPGDTSTSVHLDSQNDGIGTPVGKYGSLLAPAPILAAERPGKFPGLEPHREVPVGARKEEGRGKTWSYPRKSYKHRDPHLSGWFRSATQGRKDGRQGLGSSFSYAKEQGRDFQSQRDLTRLEQPPAEGVSSPGSLHRVIFSTEVPPRASGCATVLQGPGNPRLSSEALAVRGQNLTWVHPAPGNGGGSQRSRKDTGRAELRCSRKAVRDQIKRVVVNLEQVLGALKDVQQEMKEVVEQIDNLTSSIDLNAEEQEGDEEEEEEEEEEGEEKGGGDDDAVPLSDSSSTSTTSGVTVASAQQRPSHRDYQTEPTVASATFRGGHLLNCTTSQPPSGLLLHTQNAAASPEKIAAIHIAHSGGSPTHRCRPPSYPPTPALSPLTANLPHTVQGHAPPPHSNGPSSPIGASHVSPPPQLPPPPPALIPSVIIETKDGSYQTSQGDHPSASTLAPSTDHRPTPTHTHKEARMLSGEERPSAGRVGLVPRECTAPTDTSKPPIAQGRKGRKPPPYPHHRLYERVKKAKEPRKAPPYPEKRRLLSTTV